MNERTCSTEQCELKHYAKGKCFNCYTRERRKGKPEKLSPERRAEKLRQNKVWCANNPERRRETRNRWRKQKPELHAMQNREYQNRRRSPDGKPVGYREILAEHGMNCHLCRLAIESVSQLHFDHVIPLSRGGKHEAANIRPAHAVCNIRKGNRII